MIEVSAVSGDAHEQVGVFFRMLVGIQQDLAAYDVGLKLHAAFLEIRTDDARQISYPAGPLKQRRVDREGYRCAVGSVIYKIDAGDGIQR